MNNRTIAKVGAVAGATALAFNFLDEKFNISGDIEVSKPTCFAIILQPQLRAAALCLSLSKYSMPVALAL